MKKLYIKCICFSSLWQKHNCDTECFVKTRSTHPEVFCEKGVLRPEKKGFSPETLLKKRLWHSIYVFLWILQNLWEHFSYRTPLVAASGKLLAFIWKDCFSGVGDFDSLGFKNSFWAKHLLMADSDFFLSFSWIFTKAIQILKRQSEEMSW